MYSFFITFVRFGRAFKNGWKDKEFRNLFLFAAAILLSGTFFYHLAEGWSYLDSLFFSLTTLTTVGYGNFVPTTPESKIFTMLYIVIGIGIILGFVNAIASHARKETFVTKVIDKTEDYLNGQKS